MGHMSFGTVLALEKSLGYRAWKHLPSHYREFRPSRLTGGAMITIGTGLVLEHPHWQAQHDWVCWPPWCRQWAMASVLPSDAHGLVYSASIGRDSALWRCT